MEILIRPAATMIGGAFILEACILAALLAAIAAPATFILGLLIGIPIYLIKTTASETTGNALQRINAFVVAPAHWASGVVSNLTSRLQSILSGKPSGRRAELRNRLDEYIKSKEGWNPDTVLRDMPDDLKNFRLHEGSASLILSVAVFIDLVLIGLLVIS